MRIFSNVFKSFKKKSPINKKNNYYQNGDDDLYPSNIEGYINNSPTAKQCSNIMTNFICGNGFKNLNNFKIGEKTLLQFTRIVSRSTVNQRGVFLHIKYNANLDIASVDCLHLDYGRIGKKDDNNFSGKIAISEDFSDSSKIEWFNEYNPDKKILKYQITGRTDTEPTIEQIKKFKGQIYYKSLDDFTIYPLSIIDAVQLDCDTEHQVQVYKNISLRKGFFGKTMIITKPLVDDFGDNLNENDIVLKRKQESQRENLIKNIKSFIGVENSDGVMLVELGFEDEKLDDSILIKQIETNFNDKLFAHTEDSVSNNIIFSFNNIPSILVKNIDKALIGKSGQSIIEAQKQYYNQTQLERSFVIEIIQELLPKFTNFDKKIEYIPLIEIDATN